MAKNGNSITERLEGLRDLLEDVTECWPEQLPSVFPSDNGVKYSRALLRAADYFKLDLTKETDTDLLLKILAEVVFPSRGRQVGTAGWGVERLRQLGAHWRDLDRENPGISDSKAAEKIKKRYPQKYQSAAAIRPRLPDARLMISVTKTSEEDPYAQVMEVVRLVEVVMGDLRGLPKEKRRAALKRLPSLMSKFKEFIDAHKKMMVIDKKEAAKVERGKRTQISASAAVK